MNLADERLKLPDDPSLTGVECAAQRAAAAAELMETGRYEAAREALGECWLGAGVRPRLEGLDDRTAAEVLLQVGALSGWISAGSEVAGAQQEAAKDLISESVALFERAGEPERAAVAKSDLGLCYWREGAYAEARSLLTDALPRVRETAERAKVLLRLVTNEFSLARHTDALALLKEHAHIFDDRLSHALRGSFHNHLGLVLKQLGTAEARADYLDQAIIEFTASIYHFEQAGHERYCARQLNNLANLLRVVGRYDEAHEYLDRARTIFARHGDPASVAQVDETRARVLVAEQRYVEANRVISRSVETLERGGPSGLLADAYTVQGVVWSRLGAYEISTHMLRRAVGAGEESGALLNAGLAAVTLIEEHGERRLSDAELFAVYLRADELLRVSQHSEDASRLRACARLVVKRLAGVSISDRNFSLYGAVHDLEARFIEQALDEAGGSVTRAAKLLGLGHQSLANMLKTRHKSLLKKRTPLRKRHKSIIQRTTEREAT